MTEREVHLELSNIKIDNDNLDYIKMTGEICGKLRDDLVKLFAAPDVNVMSPDQIKRYIDLAYLTGVFNVSGLDGLGEELTRLKEIGKNPHDIFAESEFYNFMNKIK